MVEFAASASPAFVSRKCFINCGTYLLSYVVCCFCASAWRGVLFRTDALNHHNSPPALWLAQKWVGGIHRRFHGFERFWRVVAVVVVPVCFLYCAFSSGFSRARA
eukprot:RCo051784